METRSARFVTQVRCMFVALAALRSWPCECRRCGVADAHRGAGRAAPRRRRCRPFVVRGRRRSPPACRVPPRPGARAARTGARARSCGNGDCSRRSSAAPAFAARGPHAVGFRAAARSPGVPRTPVAAAPSCRRTSTRRIRPIRWHWLPSFRQHPLPSYPVVTLAQNAPLVLLGVPPAPAGAAACSSPRARDGVRARSNVRPRPSDAAALRRRRHPRRRRHHGLLARAAPSANPISRTSVRPPKPGTSVMAAPQQTGSASEPAADRLATHYCEILRFGFRGRVPIVDGADAGRTAAPTARRARRRRGSPGARTRRRRAPAGSPRAPAPRAPSRSWSTADRPPSDRGAGASRRSKPSTFIIRCCWPAAVAVSSPRRISLTASRRRPLATCSVVVAARFVRMSGSCWRFCRRKPPAA